MVVAGRGSVPGSWVEGHPCGLSTALRARARRIRRHLLHPHPGAALLPTRLGALNQSYATHPTAGSGGGDAAAPLAAVGGTLAVAGVALSAALLRLSGTHRRRVRSIAGQLQERDAQLRALESQLADANASVATLRDASGGEREALRRELDVARAELAARGGDLEEAKQASEQRR
jgi:hypothetical protein